ncbi:spore germination protein GerPE [Neobacillus rhizosphaerae]|uniref:spore germination protein GerPE n=1 Tax=Neobacillus rhizosphaerae TaxID=2880965 RepID=UPI003D2C2D4B
MLARSSCVDAIHIDIVSFSSILQLGDSCIINGFSKALAVQREAEQFYGNEGDLVSYPVYYEPIPFEPLYEDLSFSHHHLNPVIKVHHIDIIAISSASLLHVGNSKDVSMEVRVKHIRQLLPVPREEDQEQGQ